MPVRPILLALALCAGLLAGCGRGGKRADLVLINGAEPETLDPALITGQPEGRIANALFEGLTAFDPTGHAVPGVAERWEISPDGRTYTFHLRPDARWSDGLPVTAGDFVASWKRALSPATGAQYNYQLFYLEGAQDFAEGRTPDFSKVGVSAPDDRTLVVKLTNPTPFFLDLCALVTLQPVRVDIIDRVGDDWVKPSHLIGNGAYTLADWRINDRVRLKKNPLYWNAARVALDTVDVLPISKANVAFNFYEVGQADLMMDKGLAPVALLDELKKREDFHAAPFLGIYFLRFNCERGPFKDERVRRAFSLAVDKSLLTTKITRAGELPANSFVPPGIAGYNPPDGLPYDPAAARKLMEEAGFPGGKGFSQVTYLYSEGELNQAIAIELQAMWRRELGVNVSLARQEWKVYLNSLSTLDFDIARSSWVGDYPDPNTFLDMFVTGGGNNRTGWSSPAYDRLIADAAATPDPAARLGVLRDAEQFLLTGGVPVCPLYTYVGIQLYDPAKIGGIEANVLDEHPIRCVFRKDAVK